MKKYLKRIEVVELVNSKIKAIFQEKRAREASKYYQEKCTREGLEVLKCAELGSALRKRLQSKGVCPKIKEKGAMRIFLAYSLSNWEYILPIGLEPFGKVFPFEWRSFGFDISSESSHEVSDRMNIAMLDKLKEIHAEEPVDAIVGYFTSNSVSSDVLKRISDMGIAIFNFSWDDKLYFGSNAIASSIDLNLTNSPSSCIKYVAEGGLAMFWPEAADPSIHRPYSFSFDYDVSFVGKKYGWRPRFIKYLQKNGINVAVFGKGWPSGPLSDEDMTKLYSKSRINLGFSGVGHSKKLMCLKARDFEVPMSRGLYLTQNNPELELVYTVGKEILTYEDAKDCLSKIRWLLDNPDEADKIREAGRCRTLAEHTWERRFDTIFSLAGLIDDTR